MGEAPTDTEFSFEKALVELLRDEVWRTDRFCGFVCPDQHVGNVTFSGESFHYVLPEGASWRKDFERPAPRSSLPAEGARLIMVLESPHLAEFGISPRGKVDKTIQAHPRPASGPTGRQIRQKLGLQRVSLDENVRPKKGAQLHLVLVNAIQHQCSLGQATVRYRDCVFESVWKAGGRESFVGRLASLWNAERGDFIVNCCTVGSDPKAMLKAKVRDAIRTVVTTASDEKRILELTHPFHWSYQRRPVAIPV